MPAKAKTHEFRAETRKVLNILTHSLYTNREIFLRELLSNASDALEKLRYLQSKGQEVRDPDQPLEIRIHADDQQGILEICDSGIGMSEEEMIANLGTIAKSGSEQFLQDLAESQGQPANSSKEGEEEYRERDPEAAASPSSQVIGRFGIGFYSVFMVASEVEVISLSATGDGLAHAWTSDGSGSFDTRSLSQEESAAYKRGTLIRIKLKDDAKEFLAKYRLQGIIREHSNFLPFPIFVEDERINTTEALWREPKFSITAEQYTEFYKYLSFDSKAPLDQIHLAVDAPVQFNALVFIPDSNQDFIGENRDSWGLDLYVRRVLIAKNNSDLIPNFLAFLKGVVDTEDLPLNISRETLQENIVLRKISQTLVRQVLAHLEKMALNSPEKYAQFWELHGRFLKLSFQDFNYRDRVTPLLRFYSSSCEEDKLTSLDDYISRAKSGQKIIWYLSAPSREAAKLNPHLERFRRKGLEVLFLLDPIDEFALQSLGQYKDFSFKALEQAEAADLEAFPDSDAPEEKAAPLDEAAQADFDKLLQRIKEILGDKIKEVKLSDRLAGSPAVLANPEGLSSSMEKMLRAMSKDQSPPVKNLEVNQDHPLFRAMLRIFKANDQDKLLDEICLSLFDSLQLMDGYVTDPYILADRNLKLLDSAANWYSDLRQL